MILALIIFVVAMILKLNFDLVLYQARKPNRHTLGPALVLVALVGCSWAAGRISGPMWLFGWTSIFDPAMALLMGQKWYYLGDTSKLDRLQNKYPILQTLKYLLFAGSIVLFICLR